MTADDPALRALALVELVHKLGSPEPLGDYLCLTGEPCEHVPVNLYLAAMVVKIREFTDDPLAERIDAERTQLLGDTSGTN